MLPSLLPASAEGPIKLYQALVLPAPPLRESQFSIEERSLTVQDFKIGRRTTSIAHFRETNGLLQIGDRILLTKPYFMEFLITNQGVGHLTEGTLNGLLKRKQRLLIL